MVAQEWRNCGNECRIPSTLKYIWSPLNCASPNFPSCTFVFGRMDKRKDRVSKLGKIGNRTRERVVSGSGEFWLPRVTLLNCICGSRMTRGSSVFRLSLLRVSFVVVCFSSYSRLVKKFESFLCVIFRGGGVGNWAGFKVDLVIDGILRRSFFLFFFFLLDKVYDTCEV